MTAQQEAETTSHEHDKQYAIIVNAEPKTVSVKKLSFFEVVNLAYNDNPPTGPNIVFTITYRKGEPPHDNGTLDEGETVTVKDGMIFNVRATDKS